MRQQWVSAVNASLRRTAVDAGYEQEARYFEDNVRHSKQCELAERAQLLLHSAFSQQLGHLRQSTLRHLNADMVSRDSQQPFSAAAARYGQPLQQAHQWCIYLRIWILKRSPYPVPVPVPALSQHTEWPMMESSVVLSVAQTVRLPILPGAGAGQMP